MGKLTTVERQTSSVIWDYLDDWVRLKVQEFIQAMLEEEVTELLGRRKSERCKAVDSLTAYRNGHGKPRKLTLGCAAPLRCTAPG
jgi:transposase-like protein